MKQRVEIVLSDWGRWKRGENRSGLGYPEDSSRRWIDDVRSARSDVEVMLCDDEVRVMDRMVTSVLHPEARRVVVAHYVRLGPVKTKLTSLGLSRTKYYETLDFAHQFLQYQMVGDGSGRTKVSGHLVRVSG